MFFTVVVLVVAVVAVVVVVVAVGAVVVVVVAVVALVVDPYCSSRPCSCCFFFGGSERSARASEASSVREAIRGNSENNNSKDNLYTVACSSCFFFHVAVHCSVFFSVSFSLSSVICSRSSSAVAQPLDFFAFVLLRFSSHQRASRSLL